MCSSKLISHDRSCTIWSRYSYDIVWMIIRYDRSIINFNDDHPTKNAAPRTLFCIWAIYWYFLQTPNLHWSLPAVQRNPVNIIRYLDVINSTFFERYRRQNKVGCLLGKRSFIKGSNIFAYISSSNSNFAILIDLRISQTTNNENGWDLVIFIMLREITDKKFFHLTIKWWRTAIPTNLLASNHMGS